MQQAKLVKKIIINKKGYNEFKYNRSKNSW